MTLNAHSEKKMPLPHKIVKQCHITMSAKTSDVLDCFVHPFLKHTFHRNLSEGLVYFSGGSLIEPHSHHGSTLSTTATTPEMIALFPKVLLAAYRQRDGIEIVRSDREDHGHYAQTARFATAADYFAELRSLSPPNPKTPKLNPTHDFVQFSGGLAGFIGYDLAAAQHGDIAHCDPAHPEQLIAAMGIYDIYLQKETDGWALYGSNDPTLTRLYDEIIAALQSLESTRCLTIEDHSHPKSLRRFQVFKPFTAVWSVEDYASAFQRIQEYLRAGDCYQVNLTQPFVATVNGDLLTLLDDLLQLTQAPYSGYMRVGAHEILSCSPELFLSFSGIGTDGHNRVMTRPIKGTRPRSSTIEVDDIERNALMHSEKDHSENLMIVDLLRHDLSRHAVTGSVEVPALFELESFAQVHHLVSEIRATLRQDVSALDVLIDALPGGSITGAPKIRAMQIIAELEAMPRGAYCGSFGYLNHDGSGQFNVLIRTLQKYQDTLIAWAGGGITIASDVDAEYQECLDKISAILDCVNGFNR